ncbi:hypothetical protein EDD18DRAFT_1334399 [Armillaria luteobubalina]|uniref:Uncharacterized protein n=1 Tax=Armillaria luteobubalina TaxID=153913 RepID=A0AA39UJV8_9AGAR|nr:hypothetical protein EDD18DRAFT_1334399 [Armillaria luteobubalina]
MTKTIRTVYSIRTAPLVEGEVILAVLKAGGDRSRCRGILQYLCGFGAATKDGDGNSKDNPSGGRYTWCTTVEFVRIGAADYGTIVLPTAFAPISSRPSAPMSSDNLADVEVIPAKIQGDSGGVTTTTTGVSASSSVATTFVTAAFEARMILVVVSHGRGAVLSITSLRAVFFIGREKQRRELLHDRTRHPLVARVKPKHPKLMRIPFGAQSPKAIPSHCDAPASGARLPPLSRRIHVKVLVAVMSPGTPNGTISKGKGSPRLRLALPSPPSAVPPDLLYGYTLSETVSTAVLTCRIIPEPRFRILVGPAHNMVMAPVVLPSDFPIANPAVARLMTTVGESDSRYDRPFELLVVEVVGGATNA